MTKAVSNREVMSATKINPNCIGGGARFSELFPCSHRNNTALIKQISLLDTALVMTNT